MIKNTIWYPQGAGGMWIGYLVWCHTQQKIITANHIGFETGDLKKLDNSYYTTIFPVKHQDTDYYATIKLAGPYYFNFYLNFALKKHKEYSCYFAKLLIDYQQKSTAHNLDWALIYKDPKKFLKTINDLTDLNLTLNLYTVTAIEQYKKSCVRVCFDQTLFESVEWKDWANQVKKVYNYNDKEVLDFTKQYTLNF